VTDGTSFLGVYDRLERKLHLFDKGTDHGQTRPPEEVTGMDDPRVRELLGDEAHARLAEEIALLDAAGASFDKGLFLQGRLTPVHFGSALTNFGVEPFLRRFLEHAPPPGPRSTAAGEVRPDNPGFSGFVFKIQANMDPKHRDRINFVRVCSGRFEAGLMVTNHRTGKPVRLARPQQFFGQEREGVDVAFPGDVVGVHDRGGLQIGDTLTDLPGVEFGGIPSFSPEHFARVRAPDPLRRKHLDKGLLELSQEGAIQVLYGEDGSGPSPIVGAVGPLQFDVLLHRLEHEYGVVARLEPMPYRDACWVTGPEEEVVRVARGYDCALVRDRAGRPLLLFRSEWVRASTEQRERKLQFHRVAPDEGAKAA
jgi:peptide chain release factor 3